MQTRIVLAVANCVMALYTCATGSARVTRSTGGASGTRLGFFAALLLLANVATSTSIVAQEAAMDLVARAGKYDSGRCLLLP